jgi:hypothetical protein
MSTLVVSPRVMPMCVAVGTSSLAVIMATRLIAAIAVTVTAVIAIVFAGRLLLVKDATLCTKAVG